MKMHVPPLIIQQTPGKIFIEQDHGGVQIEQPPAKVDMDIEQPRLTIEHEQSKLLIDQSAALATYGLMSPMQMTRRIVEAIPFEDIIAKMARDGDRLAAVHRSTRVIAELAKEPPRPLTELNYPSPPSTLNVKFDYQPGSVRIDAQEGTVDLKVTPQKADITRIPARVRIGMLQYPSIQIEWTGRLMDDRF